MLSKAICASFGISGLSFMILWAVSLSDWTMASVFSFSRSKSRSCNISYFALIKGFSLVKANILKRFCP